jgi:hypothetical protein
MLKQFCLQLARSLRQIAEFHPSVISVGALPQPEPQHSGRQPGRDQPAAPQERGAPPRRPERRDWKLPLPKRPGPRPGDQSQLDIPRS